MKRTRAFVLSCAFLVSAVSANATIQRTFVSATGLDTNTSVRDQLCRNFTAALAQTTAGGEVVVLDSAGYGKIPLVAQPVSIVSPDGVDAAMTVFSGDGITINVPGSGITSTPAGTNELIVTNTVSRKNGNNGLDATGTAAKPALVTLTRSRFEDNQFNGIVVVTAAHITVRDSAAVGNGNAGFATLSAFASDAVQMELEGCTAFNNSAGACAISLGAGTSIVRLSQCLISGNQTGVLSSAFARILSRSNNTIEGNATDGTLSGTYAAK